MKNILIIESSIENQGCSWTFISDIDEILDVDMKQAVSDAINGVETENENYKTCDKIIFTESYGYYFAKLNRISTPFHVEHVIKHIIE